MKGLLRNISLVTIGISVSRVLGYFRDMIAARFFGATMFSDSFYAAYRIPNLFRRMLGEGALSASFVPVLNDYLQKETKSETEKFINVSFSTLLLVLSLIVLLGIFFARPLTSLIAYGFTKTPEKYELTIFLTRILFPYLLFVSLTAFSMSILISCNVFFIPSASSGLISLSEISYMLFFLPLLLTPVHKICGLAISVLVGSIIQTSLHFLTMFKKGYKLKIEFYFLHPGLKKVFFLLIPIVLSFSIEEINVFVDTICASFLREGSMTALYYSNRLILLPLALFGTSTAIVNLPLLSSFVVKNEFKKLKETINFSIRTVAFITIPASVGLLLLGLPIIRVLFERGVFTYDASKLTYSALAFYCFGLYAFANVKLLSSLFYAMKLPRIPVRISAICMIMNAVLNIILMRYLGVGGLALATSISAWSNMLLLFKTLRKKIGDIGEVNIILSTVKFLTIALIMGLVGSSLFSIIEIINRTFSLFLCIFVCISVYCLLSMLLKIKEMKLLLELLPFSKFLHI